MDISIPTEGSTWVFISPNTPSEQLFNFDNQAWQHASQVVRTYFRINGTGELHIGLRGKASQGTSKVAATFNDKTKEVTISKSTYSKVFIDTYTIDEPGYYYIDLKGISKTGDVYADISDIVIGGSATNAGVDYITEDYFYWGRRGPSVHLGYQVPQETGDVQWFYNEVTVPTNNDVIGSYFMANGFSQGYFGMQVNSATERRVLFSVWSPYSTDNPNEIPPEYQVKLLKKGEQTVVQEFGNEGSGGQSFLRYNWVAGNTYKFLLKVEPSAELENNTDYTAYFFAPEVGSWTLIASWQRPFTSTYATGLHSFLENFDTRTGPLQREVHFGNQWAYSTNGQWHELTRAKFTADATAQARARMDYSGGTGTNNLFYLKNCGFFNNTTSIGEYFERDANGNEPAIDFSLLE